MSHSVKVLLASRNKATGTEIFTIQLRYWRAIHAELMTHRAFSRNAGSSRAIPVRKVLAQVWNDPAGPIHWGANQAGMQASGEVTGWRRHLAQAVWKWAGRGACVAAWLMMMKAGVHKQVANRLLEPWQYINVVVTATDWDNFFALRCHPDAQPEFQALAQDIQAAIGSARWFQMQDLEPGEWHMPYVGDEEAFDLPTSDRVMLSTARCARVSYAPFDGNADHEAEFERHDKLVGSDPIHASPTEHQAMATPRPVQSKNFRDFIQYRWFVENRIDIDQLEEAVS